jgi:hypothetical protein
MQPYGPPQPQPQPGLPQSPPRQPSPPQPWPCPWPSWSSCCHGIPGVSGKDDVAFAMPEPSPRAANPIAPATANTAAIALSLASSCGPFMQFLDFAIFAPNRSSDPKALPGTESASFSASNLANATPYRDGSRSSLSSTGGRFPSYLVSVTGTCAVRHFPGPEHDSHISGANTWHWMKGNWKSGIEKIGSAMASIRLESYAELFWHSQFTGRRDFVKGAKCSEEELVTSGRFVIAAPVSPSPFGNSSAQFSSSAHPGFPTPPGCPHASERWPRS